MIGVIEPGARAGAAATRNRHIAVIATEGTVKGGAYMRAIHRLMRDAVVVQQPCQVFVALAEEGWTDSRSRWPPPIAISRACSAASTRRTRSCSAARISRCSPPRSARASATRSRSSNSAETTAAAVASALAERRLASAPQSVGQARFFATDSPERFARVGEIFLGRPIHPKSVELVDLLAE